MPRNWQSAVSDRNKRRSPSTHFRALGALRGTATTTQMFKSSDLRLDVCTHSKQQWESALCETGTMQVARGASALRRIDNIGHVSDGQHTFLPAGLPCRLCQVKHKRVSTLHHFGYVATHFSFAHFLHPLDTPAYASFTSTMLSRLLSCLAINQGRVWKSPRISADRGLDVASTSRFVHWDFNLACVCVLEN